MPEWNPFKVFLRDASQTIAKRCCFSRAAKLLKNHCESFPLAACGDRYTTSACQWVSCSYSKGSVSSQKPLHNLKNFPSYWATTSFSPSVKGPFMWVCVCVCFWIFWFLSKKNISERHPKNLRFSKGSRRWIPNGDDRAPGKWIGFRSNMILQFRLRNQRNHSYSLVILDWRINYLFLNVEAMFCLQRGVDTSPR